MINEINEYRHRISSACLLFGRESPRYCDTRHLHYTYNYYHHNEADILGVSLSVILL